MNFNWEDLKKVKLSHLALSEFFSLLEISFYQMKDTNLASFKIFRFAQAKMICNH